ncbi:MAG: UDP-N-acetylmuramoyl-tripeptide--D-alanyl-D-alanine ligase [Actinobacteria bacterium]|nr:MAG: UDP-N-acetylmuramoyl-tripeptide--D-alanyl-D-alanine ligase [Actinomycetota bacterium]
MRPRPLSEVARAVDGRLRGADATVTAVVIDSREAGPGSLFVAMRGERDDGHDFVTDALSRGAVGAVVHRPVAAEPVVVVADSGRALLALAADERARMRDATVIGITGANGKTSTKDLAASILSTGFLTHASPGSFNNEIGLPMTLLGAPEGVEVVLAEMGARRRGDHAELCRVAQPDAVVVTNVGVAHMEVFGSWPAIVEASAEPVEALPDVGTAILNADDTVVRDLAARTRARVVMFGLATEADVRAEDVALDDEGRAGFDLVVGDERERAELIVPGEHMVSNALAAAACGIALGLSAAECAAGLKGVGVSRWRMESFTTEDGVRVVNDAYNANPESMAAGLRAARWMARGGRLAAVLGHMAELGPISSGEHERLGELVVRLGVDRLVTVGPVARAVAGAALREGAVPDGVVCVDTPAEAAADVRGWARAGDVVLIKGSRVAGLERVAEALR